MSEDNSVDSSADALLDATLEDLADLKSFEPWPDGTYSATVIDAGTKTVNKHPCFFFKLKLKSIVEMAEETETPPKEGDESEVLYMLDNEVGQGKLKKVAADVMAALSCSTLRELKDAIKSAEILVVCSRQYNKEKKRYYGDLQAMTLA